MSSSYSTITNNVNMLLIDSSTITNFSPYVAYISSVNVPGTIATIRDSTGLLSTPGRIIIVSTLKDVLFADGTSSIRISQPFGYITMSARDKNTWSIVNNFAYPNAEGNTNVSSMYCITSISTASLVARSYISTPYINTNSITLDKYDIYTSKLNKYSIYSATNNLYAKNNVDPPTLLTPKFPYIGFVTSSYAPLTDYSVSTITPSLVNSYTFTSRVSGFLNFHLSYNWTVDTGINSYMIGTLYENGILINTQYTTLTDQISSEGTSSVTFSRIYDIPNISFLYEQYIFCTSTDQPLGDTRCRPSWTIYFTPYEI